MPQQLVYTSAPRGLVAGRSGYCTVARSAGMREALMLRLEQLSYYRHLSPAGGTERPVFAYRNLDLRGTRYHVLSRIQDAGLDFTGRTNLLAHHLVVTPEEIPKLSTPAVILRDWSGWLTSWNGEPQQLSNENWGNLYSLAGKSCLPADGWRRVSGDSVNGYALLEAKPGTSFLLGGIPERELLGLVAETMELLELRDARHNYRMAAWQYTLTTSLQEQDNPADFRWRFVRDDASGSGGTDGPSALASLRAMQFTTEEQAFARQGWQGPTFVEIHLDRTAITEGESVQLEARADGVPTPTFRWFEIERGQPVEMVGKCGAVLEERPTGRAKRYAVQAVNRAGHKDSAIAELTINQRLRLASGEPFLVQPKATRRGPGHIRTEEEMEAENALWRAKRMEGPGHGKRKALYGLLTCTLVAVLATGAAFFFSPKWPFLSFGRLPAPAVPTNSASGPLTNGLSGMPPDSFDFSSNAATSVRYDSQPESPRLEQPADFDYRPLPSNWSWTNIGKINAFTRAEYSATHFRITGAGSNHVPARADDFFFVHHATTNSTNFTARLRIPSEQSPSSRCGIMMRESEAIDAPFAFVGASPKAILATRRSVANEMSTQHLSLSLTGSVVYLRLLSSNGMFVSAYKLGQNDDWKTISTDMVRMRHKQYLVGFAVSSGDVDRPVAVEFRLESASK